MRARYPTFPPQHLPWRLFTALPRWEQAMIVAPLLLWLASLALFASKSLEAKIILPLASWADGWCDLVDGIERGMLARNQVCWEGGLEFQLLGGVPANQLIALHCLIVCLTVAMFALQLGRRLMGIQAVKQERPRRAWGLFILAIFFYHSSGLYEDELVNLPATLAIAAVGSFFLLHLRMLLSFMIPDDGPAPPSTPTTAKTPPPVIRRL